MTRPTDTYSLLLKTGMLFLVISSGLLGQNSSNFDLIELNNHSYSNVVEEDCKYTQTQIDENDMLITEFTPRLWFAYNNPQFEQFNKNDFLLKAFAKLYLADDQCFLIMHIRIASINAKRSFGAIPSQAKMKLYLSNGDHIYLESVERNRGKIDRIEGVTNYKAVLNIDKSDYKALSKNHCKKIGFYWEEGYQEYDIQNFDLIKNQMTCINK